MTIRGLEWIAVLLTLILIVLLVMRMLRGAREKSRARWRVE